MSRADPLLEISFTGKLIHWRGPAPFHFVAISDDQVGEVRWAARIASYGWGCVPVDASVGGLAFRTALFPKNGGYMLPLKAEVRKKLGIDLGDSIAITMRIDAPA
ncbi:MAG TPA: DUF1905 domain-containing protein [Sphingomonas sp.]